MAACTAGEPDASPAVEAELVESLGLRGDEVVHSVSLGGHATEEHVTPPVVEILVGEIVEFVTMDSRIHTVTFLADSLSSPALEFLRTTGQLRSPPLIRRKSRYVVTFENAPPGRYPFQSDGNGEPARGVILVH